MLFQDIVKTSLLSISRNKSRSALTMLGIVIGIASVILMLSIGKSAEGVILSQVADLGSDLIFVEPSAGDPTNGPPDPFIEQTLTNSDIEALRKSNYLAATSGNVTTSVAVSHNEENTFTQVVGVDEDYISIFPADMYYGRFIESGDVEGYTRVAVLGLQIAKDLFGDQDPIGRKIKIKDISFRVVGVFDEQGTRFFQNLDDQIAIPLTVAQRDIIGVDYVNYITMKALGDVKIAKDEVRWVLRDVHSIDNPDDDPDKDDFFVSSQSDAVAIIGVIGSVLTILLSSIAAISLVVGGIGIMNIMLVSVTERTKEIGLRKALGATKREILTQFLVEAIFLTLTGGIIGVLIGAITSVLIGLVGGKFVDGWEVYVPLSGIISGLLVASVVGVIFGVYPARRAAKLDPIEALRYE